MGPLDKIEKIVYHVYIKRGGYCNMIVENNYCTDCIFHYELPNKQVEEEIELAINQGDRDINHDDRKCGCLNLDNCGKCNKLTKFDRVDMKTFMEMQSMKIY